MAARPLISIIIPCYNVERYLSRALDGIRNQGFDDWEAIIVDDCSTDTSLSIARSYAGTDTRFKLLPLPVNRGLSGARNAGMEVAHGRYIAFLDPDDQYGADLFQEAARVIEAYDPDMLVWGVVEEYYDEKGILKSTREVVLEGSVCQDIQEFQTELLQLEKVTLFGYAWNKMYKSERLKENKLIFKDVQLIEDVLFNIDMARHIKSCVVLGRPLHRYTRNITAGSNLTARYIPNYFELSARRIEELYDLYDSWGLATGEVKAVLGAIYLRYALSALQRNCDPRSNMNRAERRSWLDAFYALELSRKFISCAAPVGLAAKFFAFLFKRQSRTVLLFFARFVYLVSATFPRAFSKLKQSR